MSRKIIVTIALVKEDGYTDLARISYETVLEVADAKIMGESVAAAVLSFRAIAAVLGDATEGLPF